MNIAVPLGSLVAGLLFAGVLLALGARVRCLVRVPVAPGLRAGVDFLLGSWTLGTALLLAGLAGAFRPTFVIAVTIAAVVAGRWRRTGRNWSGALGPGLAAVPLLMVALAPPFFFDALTYHLGLPWQALLDGRVAAHPENLFATFPPLAQLVYAPLLAAGLERSPAVLHLVAFVLAGWVVAAGARRFGASVLFANLAGGALLVLPCHALVPAIAGAEAWLVLAVVTSAVLLAGRPGPESALGAFLLGCGVAARLQGLTWVIALLPAMAVQLRRSPGAWIRSAALFVAASAPWWMKNAILLGSPVAPLGLGGEGIETLWRDGGSVINLAPPAEWAGAAVAALSGHASYMLPLGLAAFLTVRRVGRGTTWLAVAAVAGLAAWALTGNLPRFLVPTVALLLILAAAGRGRVGRITSALALGTTLALGVVFSAEQMRRWAAWRLPVDPAAVGERLIQADPRPAFALAASLPAEARVLFVGEVRGLGFPRRFLAGSQHDSSPLRAILADSESLDDTLAALRGHGVTHLLVNWSELERLSARYPIAPWRTAGERVRWQELLAGCGPPVVASGSVVIQVLPAR